MLTTALRCLSPETAHKLAIAGLRGLEFALGTPDIDPILSTTVWGLRFPSPIGMAAGFDKNAEVPGALLKLGFGFVECGTITPLPQPGNPKPRLFRDTSSRAVINRMGFNGEGMEVAAERLLRPRAGGIVGVNVGRNKLQQDAVSDYVACIARLGRLADYLVINVSSPNTPGLRDLQGKAALAALVEASIAARNDIHPACPLLVKIAPDLDDQALETTVETAIENRADGIIVGNTTVGRPDELPGRFAAETGGLSGAPLFRLSTDKLRRAYAVARGRVPLIGAGGIFTAADALEKIEAGASLVQLYTGFAFEGPGLPRRLNRELAALLRTKGYASMAEAVGKAA